MRAQQAALRKKGFHVNQAATASVAWGRAAHVPLDASAGLLPSESHVKRCVPLGQSVLLARSRRHSALSEDSPLRQVLQHAPRALRKEMTTALSDPLRPMGCRVLWGCQAQEAQEFAVIAPSSQWVVWLVV